ncbi:hypothetical protein L210DRAFT_3632598 [Boletus edulis BED1]|uniref:Uncharacterized protein n=1 Tax=Boletus edulis BED1 TaxID=1328754 RepID=A0AAD4BN61_BOLED|nr:hypothetical protein L210DRAFT_3632598 [Boletus edulis BED1]
MAYGNCVRARLLDNRNPKWNSMEKRPHPVVNEVPKSSASPLYFCPWDSGDPDMGPLCISRKIGREMWEGLREGKTPGMSESIVGAEGKAMTWTDRQCGKGLL